MKTLQDQNSLFQVAEVKVRYKPAVKPSERPKINYSKDIYNILIRHWDLDRFEMQEEFKVMLITQLNWLKALNPP